MIKNTREIRCSQILMWVGDTADLKNYLNMMLLPANML